MSGQLTAVTESLFFEQSGAQSKADVVVVDTENAIFWERLRRLI
jgi:hypothetical protein